MILYRLEVRFPEEPGIAPEPALPAPDWLRHAFDAGLLCRRCRQVGGSLWPALENLIQAE